MRTLEQARAYISELEQTIDNISASGIHSCSDQCQRPICVMRRERDAARKDRDKERTPLTLDDVDVTFVNDCKKNVLPYRIINLEDYLKQIFTDK